jgi:hypothetical protein
MRERRKYEEGEEERKGKKKLATMETLPYQSKLRNTHSELVPG